MCAKAATPGFRNTSSKRSRRSVQFEEYPGQPTEEMTIDRMIARGGAIVGTPEDAIKRIKEVIEVSGGGFGGLLVLAHEWASREKTLKSYEMLARYVMPKFQGSAVPIEYLPAMDRGTPRPTVQLLGAGSRQGDARLQGTSAGSREEGVRPGGSADYADAVRAEWSRNSKL